MVSMSVSLFWMALAVVAAPLIARLSRGRTPEVVVLLVLGVALGPHALGLATITGIEMIKQLGMGLLFLLAGIAAMIYACGGGTQQDNTASDEANSSSSSSSSTRTRRCWRT